MFSLFFRTNNKSCFFFRYVEYGVYQKAMPGFSFATTPSYTLTVECTDSVSTLTKAYTVNIDKNDSPTISNLHSKWNNVNT